MRLPEIRGRIRSVLLLGLMLLLTGCGGAAASRVGVDTLFTNVVFGAPTGNPAPAAAPAPAPPPPPSLPPQALAALPLLPAPLPVLALPSEPPAAACPSAPASAFPAEPATSDVTTEPAVGRYRWVSAGTYDVTSLGTTTTLTLPPFQQRSVGASTALSDTFASLPTSVPGTDFTYQTTEPRPGMGGSYRFTWKVKSSESVTTPADPEGGVSIAEVDVVDSTGKVTDTLFKPQTGLLILPLPATPGQNFQSATLDTTTHANSMAFNGTVASQKERVDACGTPLQAWGVDGTLTDGAATATVHFDVATQMGGLVIAEAMDGSFLGTVFHGAHFRIGQAKPDPAS